MSRVFVVTALAVLLFAAAFTGSAAHGAPTKQKGCLTLKGRAYEVCSAYLVNAVSLALVPYYKFGRSPNPARARAARNRFETRYFGQARRLFEQRLAGWQQGGEANVRYALRVVSVSTSVKTNTARLVTIESWEVSIKTFNGFFVGYAEIRANHRVTMKRVKGLVLHKWVVTGYT